jgi:hypothetical protein
VQNDEKNNLLRLEGTYRVSTMIIDWKEEENYSKRSELIIMNSSENNISDHKIYHNTDKKEV